MISDCSSNYWISIHAPTRGATRKGFYIYMDNSISIHAPTRGATNLVNITVKLRVISIHAPTRGATFLRNFMCVDQMRFQSTLPREERRYKTPSCTLLSDFNPRSHERSDCIWKQLVNSGIISIHAPTRGATKSPEVIPPLSLFQSTLPREERLH